MIILQSSIRTILFFITHKIDRSICTITSLITHTIIRVFILGYTYNFMSDCTCILILCYTQL